MAIGNVHKNLVKCGLVVFKLCEQKTDKHIHITVLCTAPGAK